MRFEARNIEQWDEKVFENEVVAEVYRAAYGSKYQNKARDEANPDDAASIAELVFHFSEDGLRDKTGKDWAMESKLRTGGFEFFFKMVSFSQKSCEKCRKESFF